MSNDAKSNEVLEGYLSKLERGFERSDDGTYVVSMGANRPPVALRVAQPVVVIQVDVGPAAKASPEVEAKVYRQLLEFNGSDLVYAAYAIENGRIVLSAAFDLSSLGLNEIEAVLADMDLALAEHIPGLRELVTSES